MQTSAWSWRLPGQSDEPGAEIDPVIERAVRLDVTMDHPMLGRAGRIPEMWLSSERCWLHLLQGPAWVKRNASPTPMGNPAYGLDQRDASFSLTSPRLR